MMVSPAGRSDRWMVVGFLVFGILSRLVPHPWNVTPVMAIALFGGATLPKGWSLWLPLAIVGVSDALIGWHATVPFTWGAVLLISLLGWWLRPRPSAGRVLAGTLAGSVLFFLVSNFGVWLVGGLYPRTAAGFWSCYVAALPFFRSSVVGDLVCSAALFGGYAAATALRPARQTAGRAGFP